MTTLEKWKVFSKQATTHLKTGDKPELGESFLEFGCEPSFEAHFNIMVIWKGNEGTWSKTVWDIVADRERYFERDNKPKALVIDKAPSIYHQSGKLQFKELERLKSMIEKLCIVPPVEPLRSFTLDGSMKSVSLGVDELRSSFSWHTLPDHWENLQELADFVSKICTERD
jgi:hypothetical protein